MSEVKTPPIKGYNLSTDYTKLWECSQCGDQSYTPAYSKNEVNECLQCPVCGGTEFELKDAKP